MADGTTRPARGRTATGIEDWVYMPTFAWADHPKRRRREIVAGSVGHWGHVHQRINQYVARFTVEPLDDVWKIRVGRDLVIVGILCLAPAATPG